MPDVTALPAVPSRAAVQEELGIPVVTGMYIENPGADMFKKEVYISFHKEQCGRHERCC